VGKPVIIGHGVSGHEAFMNMILVAEKVITTDFLKQDESLPVIRDKLSLAS
jgi:hypothetical protein